MGERAERIRYVTKVLKKKREMRWWRGSGYEIETYRKGVWDKRDREDMNENPKSEQI